MKREDGIQRLPSGRYRIRWIDHDGKRLTETFDSASAAKAARRRHLVERDEVRAGLAPAPRPEAPTFAAFAASFMQTYVVANNKPSERVAKSMHLRLYLLPAFGEKRLDAIGMGDVEGIKARLVERGLAPKSINNTLVTLGRILRYARELRVIGEVPLIKPLKNPPSDVVFLDFDELDRLVAACDEEMRAVVLLGAHAGLRSAEIRALQWGDLDLVAGRVTIQRSVYVERVAVPGEKRRKVVEHIGSPKGGRPRHVPLTRQLLAALKAIRHMRGPFVLCDADGKMLGERSLTLRLVAAGVRAKLAIAIATNDRTRECRRAAKIRKTGKAPTTEQAARIERYQAGESTGFGLHTLRHTFCSHLAMRGAAARAIQDLAGHANLTTTQRYMHLSPSAPRAAIALLESSGGASVSGHGVDTRSEI